jgi:methylated-DNA-[protein]-cysteine S-methyltransferase
MHRSKVLAHSPNTIHYTILSNLELIDKVLIAGNDDGLIVLNIQKDENVLTPDPSWKFLGEKELEKEPNLLKAKTQLLEYLRGERTAFDLPLSPKGTPFEHTVWQAVQKIPYGITKSYAQIAREIGNPKAVRAVGNANRVNPIEICIPCHRVISSTGELRGYAAGVAVKRKLLDLEQSQWRKKQKTGSNEVSALPQKD